MTHKISPKRVHIILTVEAMPIKGQVVTVPYLNVGLQRLYYIYMKNT